MKIIVNHTGLIRDLGEVAFKRYVEQLKNVNIPGKYPIASEVKALIDEGITECEHHGEILGNSATALELADVIILVLLSQADMDINFSVNYGTGGAPTTPSGGGGSYSGDWEHKETPDPQQVDPGETPEPTTEPATDPIPDPTKVGNLIYENLETDIAKLLENYNSVENDKARLKELFDEVKQLNEREVEALANDVELLKEMREAKNFEEFVKATTEKVKADSENKDSTKNLIDTYIGSLIMRMDAGGEDGKKAEEELKKLYSKITKENMTEEEWQKTLEDFDILMNMSKYETFDKFLYETDKQKVYDGIPLVEGIKQTVIDSKEDDEAKQKLTDIAADVEKNWKDIDYNYFEAEKMRDSKDFDTFSKENYSELMLRLEKDQTANMTEEEAERYVEDLATLEDLKKKYSLIKNLTDEDWKQFQEDYILARLMHLYSEYGEMTDEEWKKVKDSENEPIQLKEVENDLELSIIEDMRKAESMQAFLVDFIDSPKFEEYIKSICSTQAEIKDGEKGDTELGEGVDTENPNDTKVEDDGEGDTELGEGVDTENPDDVKVEDDGKGDTELGEGIDSENPDDVEVEDDGKGDTELGEGIDSENPDDVTVEDDGKGDTELGEGIDSKGTIDISIEGDEEYKVKFGDGIETESAEQVTVDAEADKEKFDLATAKIEVENAEQAVLDIIESNFEEYLNNNKETAIPDNYLENKVSEYSEESVKNSIEKMSKEEFDKMLIDMQLKDTIRKALSQEAVASEEGQTVTVTQYEKVIKELSEKITSKTEGEVKIIESTGIGKLICEYANTSDDEQKTAFEQFYSECEKLINVSDDDWMKEQLDIEAKILVKNSSSEQ